MNNLIIADLEMNLELDREAMKGLSGGRKDRKFYKGYEGYKGNKGKRRGYVEYGYQSYYKEEHFSYGCYTPKYHCCAPQYFYGGYGC